MLKLLNFNQILEHAKSYYNSLEEERKKKIKEELDHGKAILNNNDQLKAYIALYGDMHREKLLKAFQHIPIDFFSQPISVIDWGCGQGLATLLLDEYLRSIKTSEIREVVLIEPSLPSISVAENYIRWTIPDASLIPIPQKEQDVLLKDLPFADTSTIHLLSNVVDMKEFFGDTLKKYVYAYPRQRHIIVCVSPYYQEEGRGKRMYEFGDSLKGFKRTYCFQRHKDQWDKDFSCQIHIYDSNTMYSK